MEQEYTFCALLSRMKYINRWGLMRSSRCETLSEHTAEAAILAHVLALIEQEIFANKQVNPEKVAVAALYHDASEIITGDMPTPVKYKNEELRTAYKKLEKESAAELARTAPPEIEEKLRQYLTAQTLTEEERRLLKAADRLSALIKCMEEEAAGNTEFRSAQKQQLNALQSMQSQAVDYFIVHLLPSYRKNLDELTES